MLQVHTRVGTEKMVRTHCNQTTLDLLLVNVSEAPRTNGDFAISLKPIVIAST